METLLKDLKLRSKNKIMKISYNWLKTYLDINKTPEELADILTNTGLEVEKLEHFESIKGGLEGYVVGKVTEKEKHTNADSLSVTKVDIGATELLSIVCGAPNVAAGQKVVVATIGTTVYDDKGDFKIKKTKLRGEASEGMLCSAVELGLGTDHDGIMVLPENTVIGTAIKDLFEIESDYIFEIGLTPNRSDAMSHIGVARDIAAAVNVFNKEKIAYFKPKFSLPAKASSTKSIKVSVEDVANCPRYSSILIDKVTVAESPLWLQNRLKSIGLKPVNNIVDITNFVLKEYGQPLHAFDADEIIGNEVIVKKTTENTTFVCLDDKELKLSSEDLMICNQKEAMCIAGVFGGAKSGVKSTTKTIFLESAYFNSVSIRKTSTRHKLQTDAASRYEKGADPSITIEALKRAASLICELANGEIISEIQDFYPKEIPAFKVSLRYSRLNSICGTEIPETTVKQILKDLEIQIIEENGDTLNLNVPQYRADVQREIDVIEEVLRIYGFNNIETPAIVHSTLSFTQGIDVEMLKNSTSDKLNGLGFSEIMTNSISKSTFYSEKAQENLVRLQNSMTAELDIMRQNLLYDGLEVLAHNINRKQSNLKFFEFGNIYNADYSQNEKLVLYMSGDAKAQNWIQQKEKSNFYHLMAATKAILSTLKIKDFDVEESDNEQFEYSLLLLKNGKTLGEIGLVNEKITAQHSIKQEVYYAVLDWKYILKLNRKNKPKFEAIPKYPEVTRDLAIVLNEEIKFNAIKNIIFKSAKKYLSNLELFDVFRDKEKVGAGKKSYAISIKLIDKEKTLVDKEIDKTIANIVGNLQKELNATIRG